MYNAERRLWRVKHFIQSANVHTDVDVSEKKYIYIFIGSGTIILK